MIKKSTIFDFLENVMLVYGITITCLCVLCMLCGEDAIAVSSIFRMGEKGLALPTLLQFLLVSVVISGFQWLFFTDKIIKNMSIPLRSVGMFACIIVLVGACAVAFQWFPVNMLLPWIMFYVCFFTCSALGILISTWKERMYNKKMEDALNHLKNEESKMQDAHNGLERER